MGLWDVILLGAGYGGLCAGVPLAHACKKDHSLEEDAVIVDCVEVWREEGGS
jgi:hypothetical protein